MKVDNDQFAQIAIDGIGGRTWLLTEPKPKEFVPRKYNLTEHLTGP